MALITPFQNGSIEGVALGDELAAGGVPVGNLSSVASFIKAALAGTGVYVTTNEDSTSFGGQLHGPQFHYPGSFADFGSVPSDIDFISIDEQVSRRLGSSISNSCSNLRVSTIGCVQVHGREGLLQYYRRAARALRIRNQPRRLCAPRVRGGAQHGLVVSSPRRLGTPGSSPVDPSCPFLVHTF